MVLLSILLVSSKSPRTLVIEALGGSGCTNCRPRSVHLVLETGLLHEALDIGDLLREGDALVADLDHFTLVSLAGWIQMLDCCLY